LRRFVRNIVINQEPLIASRNRALVNSKKWQPTIVDIFVTSEFGRLSHIGMNPARKALADGMLIFIEITVVVLFVMSLAAIAALSALGSRKRNYALEDANGAALDSLSH
jgi:hypothetical protein